MSSIINIMSGSLLYKLGCQIWNGFMDVALSFLTKTPEEIDKNLWGVIMDNIFPIFIVIGVACATVFFFMGLYRDVTEFRHVTENPGQFAFVLMRLVICQAGILALQPFITGAFESGKYLSTLIMQQMGLGSGGYGHLDAFSTFLANGDEILSAGLILGIIFFLSALVCGATICLSVYGRIFKMIFAAPTGALAVSTIAGGGGISRTAEGWLREFFGVVLEASFIVLAIGIAVPFMNVNLFPGSGTASDVMSIIEPAFKMFLVAGAVKGCSSIFRKYLSL